MKILKKKKYKKNIYKKNKIKNIQNFHHRENL